MQRPAAKEFLDEHPLAPILDVRSPAEFEAGHIPEAISLPLFEDAERAEVGTIYKQDSRETAIKKGLEIVGPKMVHFIEAAEKLNSKVLKLYCWRGGMRSESMAWLLERYGFKVFVLKGGYKGFRGHFLETLKQNLNLRILTGNTGAGKTELLLEMKNQGAQVIDLEGLANHQGSSFGNQKSASQPSTEQFQNALFYEFHHMNLDEPIWLEDESICIGQVVLPVELFKQMNEASHVLLKVDQQVRVARLTKDYGKLDSSKLIEATNAIKKKLGFDQAKIAVELIEQGDLFEAASIIIKYYDRNYEKSLNKKKSLIEASYDLGTKSMSELATHILNENLCQSN